MRSAMLWCWFEEPTVQEIDVVYRHLKKHLPDIMKRAGAKTAFGAKVFAELRVAVRVLVDTQRVARGKKNE